MVGQQEARLNLVLSAKDEASKVIEDFVIKTKERLGNLGKILGEAFNPGSVAASVNRINEELKNLNFNALGVNEFKTTIESALNSVRENVDLAVNDMISHLDRAKIHMEETATSAKSIKKTLDFTSLQIAGQMIENFGLRLSGFFLDSIKSAAGFDQEIHNTIASMKALDPTLRNTKQIYEELKQKALDLGSAGFFSANEIAEGMNVLAKQGIKGTETIKAAIQTVHDVAAANQEDLKETANVVSDIYHEFGSQLKHDFGSNVNAAFTYIGNIMTSTLHHARMSMTDFLNTLKMVGPNASSAGWTLKDVAEATALLAQHGIRGTQAGTTLRRMLVSLTPATKAATQEMVKLGIITKDQANQFFTADGKAKPFSQILEILHNTIGRLNPQMQNLAIKTLFSMYAMSGVSAIAGTTKQEFEDLVRHFGDANVTTDALKEKQQGLGFQLQKLNATFETFKKVVGDAFKGVVEVVVPAIRSVLQWFINLDPNVRKAIVLFGGVVSVAAIVGGALLSLVGTIGILATSFSEGLAVLGAISGPVGIVVGAIAGLVAIIAALKYAWDHNLGGIRQVTEKVWGFVKAQFNAAMTVLNHTVMAGINAITKWWNKLYPDFNHAMSNIMKFLIALSPLWHGMWNNMANIVRFAWNTIGTILRGAWGVFSGVFQLIMHLVSGDWKKLWDDVKQIFSSAFHTVTGLLHNLWQFIANGFSNVLRMVDGLLGGWPSRIIKYFKDMFNNIVNGFNSFGKNVENIWNGFKNWLSHTTQAIVQFVVKAFEWLYHHNYYFQYLVDSIVKWWNWLSRVSSQVWSVIKSFLLSVWNTLKSAAMSVWNSVASFLSGVWNRIRSAVSSAWNSVASTFSSVWNRIKGYVHNGVTFIWNMLSNLASHAWSWGANLMNMLASGIESGIDRVIGAAENVARQIARFLGFHSPTEDGPASDSDTWMPNMLKMFAKGIEEYRPLLQKEIFKIAMDLQYTLNPKIEHSQALQTAQEVSKKMTENMNNVMNLVEKARTVKELPDPYAEPESPNAYDRVAGHSSHRRYYYMYDFVPGHTSHHPTTTPRTASLYDRVAGHRANHVVVNIHIEGRSKETDRQLVDMIQDQLVRKFRTYMPMHTTV